MKFDHTEKAAALFTQGYNCAQSVFVAFSDVTGMDEELAKRLSSSFGGGMGRLRVKLVCLYHISIENATALLFFSKVSFSLLTKRFSCGIIKREYMFDFRLDGGEYRVCMVLCRKQITVLFHIDGAAIAACA